VVRAESIGSALLILLWIRRREGVCTGANDTP